MNATLPRPPARAPITMIPQPVVIIPILLFISLVSNLTPHVAFFLQNHRHHRASPLRFRRKHGLQTKGARIAPSKFVFPASRALLLPVVPPRSLRLSSLHARTALRSNSAGPAPCVPSGCRSRASRRWRAWPFSAHACALEGSVLHLPRACPPRLRGAGVAKSTRIAV